MHTLPYWIFKSHFHMRFGKIDANDDPELEVCTLFLTVTEGWRTVRLWDEKKKSRWEHTAGHWPLQTLLITKPPKLTSLIPPLSFFSTPIVSFNTLLFLFHFDFTISLCPYVEIFLSLRWLFTAPEKKCTLVQFMKKPWKCYSWPFLQ